MNEIQDQRFDEIILQLQDIFVWWKDYLQGKEQKKLIHPVLDDRWSLKDVLTHLYMWQLVSRARLKAAIGGTKHVVEGWPGKFEPETKEELDELNDWMWRKNKDMSWEDVWKLWKDGFEEVLRFALAVPREYWFDREKFEWLHGSELFAVLEGTLGHHREHREMVE